MMALTYIYAHLEPDTNEIRYVGKANDPRKRLQTHISEAKRGAKGRHNNWLRSLQAEGLAPRREIIAEVPVEEWEFWEQHYIKYFRDLGFDLTNTTPGGEGVGSGPEHFRHGKPLSADHRAKLRAINLGKRHTSESIAKMRAVKIGKKHTPEACANMSAAQMGKSLPPETRAKMSAASLGRKKTPEHCATMRAGWARRRDRIAGRIGFKHGS